MTKDDMIVAGAKAMFPFLRAAKGNRKPADERQLAEFVAMFDAVEACLTAVIPGILKGTHAELPVKATPAMVKEAANWTYDAMVAAYLEEKAG